MTRLRSPRSRARPAWPWRANTNLDWTPDGARLVVALRTPDQDREAKARFAAITQGPVIVQKSSDPFLDWDALNRANRERELAEFDVKTGQKTTILRTQRLTSYDVARDGSFITYQQDVTQKTVYDVIGGAENDLMLLKRGAEPKRLARGADLKDARLQRSEDGRWFAYAKKGEVFVQSVDDEQPRSLTPRPPAEKKEGEAEKADAKPGEEKKSEPESFSVGPFSDDASKLLITIFAAAALHTCQPAAVSSASMFSLPVVLLWCHAIYCTP